MHEHFVQKRLEWAKGDAVRDEGLTTPENIFRHDDIRYGEDAMNLLDVYYLKGTDTPQPTIISIHGGGWFYGDKELYSHYCMRLAQRGFTVVNFTYRLAPEHKYPAPLEDTCAVLRWVKANAEGYCIDLNNLFMVGDSAGGQLCHQICTMLTNPQYAAMFSFPVPEDIRINACALNCGCYFFPPFSRLLPPKKTSDLFGAYFPEEYLPILPQLKVKKYATKNFPPAFVMTAQNDYLRFMAAPLYRVLKRKGVECQLHVYGTKEQKEIGHVFHVNCKLDLAAKCNDDECAFFRAHLR